MKAAWGWVVVAIGIAPVAASPSSMAQPQQASRDARGQHTLIEFARPVAPNRLKDAIAGHGLRPIALQHAGPIGGGFSIGGMELDRALAAYQRLYKAETGSELEISSVRFDGNVLPHHLRALRSQVALRRVIPAEARASLAERPNRERSHMEANLRLSNQTIPAPGLKEWTPAYGKVHATNTGDPDLPRHVFSEMTWDSQASIDAFPSNYGYEHDFWMHNENNSGSLRSACLPYEQNDFWATRGGGQAMFWNFPEAVDPYFEQIEESDSCRDMDLSVGMFTPQNLQPNVRYWASLHTVGNPDIAESPFVLRSALMPNDCPNDVHVQSCVGLPEYGEQEYFEPLIGRHDGPVENVPGCFRWTHGAGHNECYDITADGPTGYWRLGDVTGTIAKAEIGLDGQYSGGVGLARRGALRGDPDHAVALDGTGSVTVPHYPELATNALTAEAWVRTPTNAGVRTVVGRAGAFNLAVMYGRGRAVLNVTTNNGYTTDYLELVGGTNLYDGRWHHLAVTFDGTTARLFVDGREDAATSYLGELRAPIDTPLTIGKGQVSNDQFVGDVDEVAVYDHALAATDFEKRFSHRWEPRPECAEPSEYAAVVCGSFPSGYWRFNERHWTTWNTARDFTSMQDGIYGQGVSLEKQGAVAESVDSFAAALSGAADSFVTVP